MTMLEYVNGKSSNHLFTVLLGMIWGAVRTSTYYIEKSGDIDIIGTFLLATTIGLTVAGGLGWVAAKILKNENLLLPVANWFLIIGCILHIVTQLVLPGPVASL